MKLRYAAALAFCLCGTPAWAQTAEEKFAALMQSRLDPTATLDLRGFAKAPKPRVGPSKVERPDLPIAPAELEPPPAPLPAGRPVRPRLGAEPPALSELRVHAQAPPQVVLPAGPLAKQWAPDVKTPIPLPLLGGYVADRVSLADPSLEASVGLTREPQTPARAGEAPFSPWNLPDPFEHANTVRLRQPWPEDPNPPTFPVRPTSR